MFVPKLIPMAAIAAVTLLLPHHAAAQGSCAGKLSVITIESSSTSNGATSKVEYFAKVKNLGGGGQRYLIQFTYGLRPMQEKVDGGASRLIAPYGMDRVKLGSETVHNSTGKGALTANQLRNYVEMRCY